MKKKNQPFLSVGCFLNWPPCAAVTRIIFLSEVIYLPVPPKMCMSICSSRHITKVLTWGSNPNRKMTGKHKANTVGQKRKENVDVFFKVLNYLYFRADATNKTNQWAYLWHRARSVQRRRWHHRGRRAAGFQHAPIDQRSKSSHSTSRSTQVDCTQLSSYGPVKYQTK